MTDPTGAASPTDPTASDELVEVLGPDGSVVDIVTRHRMRTEGLAHRATYVVTVLTSGSPVGAVDHDLSRRTEQWLDTLRWPLLGPGDRQLPELAPPDLWPGGALTPATPVVVHRRADWKDVYPGYWDLAFGGVCGVAERWLEAAERELTEEAGLPTRSSRTGADTVPVSVWPVAAGRYADGRNDTFGVAFLAVADREPVAADGEVTAIDQVPLADLGSWVRTRPVCPDSEALVVPLVSALLDS